MKKSYYFEGEPVAGYDWDKILPLHPCETIGERLVLIYKLLQEISECVDNKEPAWLDLRYAEDSIWKLAEKLPRKLLDYIPKVDKCKY